LHCGWFKQQLYLVYVCKRLAVSFAAVIKFIALEMQFDYEYLMAIRLNCSDEVFLRNCIFGELRTKREFLYEIRDRKLY